MDTTDNEEEHNVNGTLNVTLPRQEILQMIAKQYKPLLEAFHGELAVQHLDTNLPIGELHEARASYTLFLDFCIEGNEDMDPAIKWWLQNRGKVLAQSETGAGDFDIDDKIRICSECGTQMSALGITKVKYCPNCGKDNREEIACQTMTYGELEDFTLFACPHCEGTDFELDQNWVENGKLWARCKKCGRNFNGE